MLMTPMKWFYGFLKKYRKLMIGGLILTTVIAALSIVNPYISGIMVDDVIVGGNIAELKYLLLGFLGVGIGRCVFQYVKEYTFDKNGIRISADMRRDLFRHVQGLSADFFRQDEYGES